MKRLLIVLLLMVVWATGASASQCIKCTSGNCDQTDYSYWVNCMSNGTTCRAWTACTGPLGGDPCGTMGHPPCDPVWKPATETFRLAKVEVRPAPRATGRWVLTAVTLEPADAIK